MSRRRAAASLKSTSQSNTLFQEIGLTAPLECKAWCAEIQLPDGSLIRLGAEATAEQIETILGMLAC